MEFSHISVLASECIEGLDIRPDGIYVDGTAGGAGHSSLIAARLNEKGRLISLDRDPDAVKSLRRDCRSTAMLRSSTETTRK